MVYFRTVASSKIYIFTSYHKLFFRVLLRMKSTASLQNIFSFLLNHSCASKVGGVSRKWNLSFFGIFNPIFQKFAVNLIYLRMFTAKNSTSCLTKWKNMCGKLPSSYRYHGNNHIALLETKIRKSTFK